MNKQILFIVGILCLTLMSANLVITDNPKDIETDINENNTFTISVMNNYSFDIYDLTFEDLDEYGFEFPSNITITSGETKTITFYVKTTSSYHNSFYSNVKFYYLVDLPEETTNYNLYISNSGFDEDYLTIRAEDTLTFTNEDTISHSIYIEGYGTTTVASNSSQTIILSTIGTFDFYDTAYKDFSFFNGQVQVVSRTEEQKVHNPNYDTTWTINLESNLNPTTLSVSNSQSDYNITNKKSKNGQLTLKNNGSEIAELVTASATVDWIYFDENELTIEADDTEWLGYTIMPYFFNTNQTDKNYTITVTISGSNIPDYEFIIYVYVPYQEVTDGFDSDYEYLVYLDNVYCPKYPCSAFCTPELPECNIDSNSSGGNSTSSLNVTADSWYEVVRTLSEIQESNDRLLNTVNEYKELYGDLNESTSDLSGELDKTTKNQKEITTIIGIIFFSIIIVGLVLWKIKNWNKRTEQQRRGKLSTKWHEE